MAVTDDFNRADAATLGANWTQQYGGGVGGSAGITSSKAGPPTNTSDLFGDYYSAIAFANDQYAQGNSVNDVNPFPTSPAGGASVRNTGTSTATANGYAFYYGAGIYLLNKIINGAETLLQFPIQNGANNDLLRLEVSGSTLKMFKNGVQLGTDQVDAAIASGSPGVILSGANAQIDNFEGGDLVVAATWDPSMGAILPTARCVGSVNVSY